MDRALTYLKWLILLGLAGLCIFNAEGVARLLAVPITAIRRMIGVAVTP